MTVPEYLPPALTLFPMLMIVAGAGDVMTRRIPNRLTLLIAGLFFPVAIASGMPLAIIGINVATAVLLLVAGFLLFLPGCIGGGDAKLLAAAGLWIGFPAVLPFLMFTALAGGVVAVAIGVWFMVSFEAQLKSPRLGRLVAPLAPDVPYGFPLAAGAILALPDSWWIRIAGL